LTDGAYQNTIQNHPELAGEDKNSLKVAQAYLADNRAAMQKTLGRDPSDEELQLSIAIGAGAAAKAIQAGPNTPISSVLSPEAMARNPQWAGMTVAQVTDAVNNPHGGSGGGTQTAGPGAGTGSASPTDLSAGTLFAQAMKRIDDLAASQPAMWQRLREMQQQYLQNAQITPAQQLHDQFAQWAMMQNAADANLHASPGGVYWHSLPNPEPFQRAIAGAQSIEDQQRQRQLDLARTQYQTGADMIKGQMLQAYQNVGLSNGMAKSLIDYQTERERLGIESARVQVALGELGLKQTQDVENWLRQNVPNPYTASQILTEATQDPRFTTGSFTQRLQILSDLREKHRQAGDLLGNPSPVEVTYNDPSRGTPENPSGRQTVTMDEQRDDAKIQQLKAQFPNGFLITRQPASQTINNFGTGPGGGGGSGGTGAGGGGGKAVDPIDSARETIQSVNDAKQILAAIHARGGSLSQIFDDPDNKLAQTAMGLATNAGLVDPTDRTLHQLWMKTMQRVRYEDIRPFLRDLGRTTQTEVQMFMQMGVGPNYQDGAAEAFLDFAGQAAVYRRDKAIAESQARQAAQDQGNRDFNLETWSAAYDKQHEAEQPHLDISKIFKTPPEESKSATAGGGIGARSQANRGQPTPTTPPAYKEGDTATGPNGEKLIFHNGGWIPA
jgi:hypothetical protein